MEGNIRNETIEELKVALAELESEEGLERFIGGHGLQSRFFAFEWHDGRLEIDFNLPYARVLSDEETQAEDAVNIGAAIRFAILLLAAEGEGRLLADGEAVLSVTIGEYGQHYAITGTDGETTDSGDSWEPLIARLNSLLSGDGGNLQVIWP